MTPDATHAELEAAGAAETQCPYCDEPVLIGEEGARQAQCGACQRQFQIVPERLVECPGCGTALRVRGAAPAVVCGVCLTRVALAAETAAPAAAATARRSDSTPATDDGTAAAASGQDYEAARLEALRESFADRYDVLEVLGHGGMGAVFTAKQKHPERLVVLKLMLGGRFASPRFRARFEREAQAVARLKHPGIVPVYEFGEVNGQPYFTMEHVEGCNIREYVQRHGLDKRGVCELMVKVCRAVAYAHQRGVIHRDLKPGNVLVTGDGTPRLLDFGLARLHGDYSEEDAETTSFGEVVGTPSYMSPEQTLGRAEDLDVRSDVYSLGALFYELLTGQLPYRVDRSKPLEAMRVIRQAVPRPPSTHNPKVDADLDSVVMKCLEKERESRYQSAVEMAEDVGRYLRGQPVEARPWTGLYHLQKLLWRRRHVVLPLILALGVLLVVGGVLQGGLVRQRDRWRTEAQSAARERAEVVGYFMQFRPVTSGIEGLLAQGRWQEAYAAATFAEQRLGSEPGMTGLAEQVRQRIAAATADEEQRVRHLVADLEFAEARQRVARVAELAQQVGLPDLRATMDRLGADLPEQCWQATFAQIQHEGGSARVLEKFLAECPQSPRAAEARALLRQLMSGIRFAEWPFPAEEAERRRSATADVLGIPAERTLELDRSTVLPLVLVPAGEFLMGAADDLRGPAGDARPSHRVRLLNPFYVGAAEVTNRQYEAATGRCPAGGRTAEEHARHADLPALVSWQDAALFCAEVSRRGVLTVQLPTEAEWEYACRAGCEASAGCGAADQGVEEVAWCRANSDGTTHAVCLKPANPWGLHDMLGNAAEWCADWYDGRYYSVSPVDDPGGPQSGAFRVVRGGSFEDAPEDVSAVARKGIEPDGRTARCAFRVCAEVISEERSTPQPATPLPVTPAE